MAPPSNIPEVLAVQCPNPSCQKFMLVEMSDAGKVKPCLLCKTPIQVGEAPPTSVKPESQ